MSDLKKEWLVHTGPEDTSGAELQAALQKIIMEQIGNQIAYHPKLKVYFGPFGTTTKSNPSLVLCKLEIVTTVEIRQIDTFNVEPAVKDPKLCYYVDNAGPFILDGAIAFVNEVWLPSEKERLRLINGRQDMADTLKEDLGGLASTIYTAENVPSAYNDVFRITPSKHFRYYVITQPENIPKIEQLSKKNRWISHWSLNQELGNDARILLILFRQDRNMIQVNGYWSYSMKGWNNQTRTQGKYERSGWYVPKNVMLMIKKFTEKHNYFDRILCTDDKPQVQDTDDTQSANPIT